MPINIEWIRAGICERKKLFAVEVLLVEKVSIFRGKNISYNEHTVLINVLNKHENWNFFHQNIQTTILCQSIESTAKQAHSEEKKKVVTQARNEQKKGRRTTPSLNSSNG